MAIGATEGKHASQSPSQSTLSSLSQGQVGNGEHLIVSAIFSMLLAHQGHLAITKTSIRSTCERDAACPISTG